MTGDAIVDSIGDKESQESQERRVVGVERPVRRVARVGAKRFFLARVGRREQAASACSVGSCLSRWI